jgi:hypothetical protein
MTLGLTSTKEHNKCTIIDQNKQDTTEIYKYMRPQWSHSFVKTCILSIFLIIIQDSNVATVKKSACTMHCN